MTILLEQVVIPEQGSVHIHVDRCFEIKITAEEARRKVNHWLLNEVSCTIGAEDVDLAIAEQTSKWRVSAVLTAPHIGHVGIAGKVDVDVETGEIENPSACKQQILQRAKALVEKMPLYTPRAEVDSVYVAQGLQPRRTPPQGNPRDIVAALA